MRSIMEREVETGAPMAEVCGDNKGILRIIQVGCKQSPILGFAAAPQPSSPAVSQPHPRLWNTIDHPNSKATHVAFQPSEHTSQDL